jgi:hypothetical protein
MFQQKTSELIRWDFRDKSMSSQVSLPVRDLQDIAPVTYSPEEATKIVKDAYERDSHAIRLGKTGLISLHSTTKQPQGTISSEYSIKNLASKIELKPHLFEIAAAAFWHLMHDEEDQLICLR